MFLYSLKIHLLKENKTLKQKFKSQEEIKGVILRFQVYRS